ncbi:NAD glycohydrolase toxin immunity factor [Clostridium felsineum]|uniref:Uncharacterized protein n=1 Tax=Clostridium felsineum TaxID=36839 RepID=A0A1S8KYD4_9CLOT|nr:NAD glycohydrolase toxin immunity factor [Clostridium felsineum]URZ01289.1 hypothetical protein CLAUR_012780 [Clostridium felsineum]URZ05972.1 hypothetical protein CLROS_013040 [Clostridium felsineum]URZ11009.1 hypothetical protein CROST_017250 [Clostridium felsineum]
MNIEQTVIKAIERDELYKVLLGEDGYKVELSSFIGTNVPTDWPNIMRGGIYKIFNEYPELNIKSKLEDTLFFLVNKGTFEIYVAISVLFFQIMSEENKTSPFKINKDKLVDNVHDALVKNKTEMYKYKEWMGQYYSNGLWGEIERINNILKEDYNITII